MGLEPYYDEIGITIYHGDCREVLPSLSKVDLLLTDPPYGMNWCSGRGDMGGISGDDGTFDVEACIRLALAQLRFHRHAYVFGPLDLSALTTAATAELIWDKGKHGSGNLSMPWGPSHERIAFAVWSPYKSAAKDGGLAARLRRGSIINVPMQNNGRGALTHPTEKPVMLMRQLIEASSLFGETVLDPFAGSGSTLVAAALEGRKAIGIELDEAHCETAAKRLAQGSFDFASAEEGGR